MKIKILDYSNEVLRVSLGTNFIWSYKPVTQEMYEKLQAINEDNREKEFTTMVRSNFLIGSIKEVDNNGKI